MAASNYFLKICTDIKVLLTKFINWLCGSFKKLFSKKKSQELVGLLNAIKHDDFNLVKKLLDEKKVDIKAHSGKLLDACISNKGKQHYTIKYDLLELLIKEGADIDQHLYADLRTIWGFAFEWLDTDLIRFLLKMGAPITNETLESFSYFIKSPKVLKEGFSPEESVNILREMLDLFLQTDNIVLDPNSEAQTEKLLGYVIRKGHIDVVKRTLAKADPTKTLIYKRTYQHFSEGESMVRVAVQHNQPAIANLLIDFHNKHKSIFKNRPYGIDEYYAHAYYEHDIFMDAIKANNLELVKSLLNSPEIHINAQIESEKPSLYFAMEKQNYNMVQLLLDKDAKLGMLPYSQDELAFIAAFKTKVKALLRCPQQGLTDHLPPELINIVGDYLIPDYEAPIAPATVVPGQRSRIS